MCTRVWLRLSVFGFGQLISGIFCVGRCKRGHPTTSSNQFDTHTHIRIYTTKQTPLTYTQFDCIANHIRIFVLVNFPECPFDAMRVPTIFFNLGLHQLSVHRKRCNGCVPLCQRRCFGQNRRINDIQRYCLHDFLTNVKLI